MATATKSKPAKVFLQNAKTGYNPHFFDKHPIALPKAATPPDAILDYTHFSVAMNAKRRMTMFTAVNIDAVKYNDLKEKAHIPSRKEIGADKWVIDPNFHHEAQLDKKFYKNNDFDLGHMVRREDPFWGDSLEEALKANEDTFFLTNATPQHKDFNEKAARWKGLEDYALANARKHDLRLTVFSGCIFSDHDRKFNGVQIPAKFFKVIVMIKKNDELSATGYIVNQDDLIKAITTDRGLGDEQPEEFVYTKFSTYQVPLKAIEVATGLQFGLNEHDPLQKTKTRGLGNDEPLSIDDFSCIVF